MPRRAPMQQRSRERVERILEVASALIAATGSDAMRMSEVAEKSGISIGSLYQYFPDKGAILRTLAERYNAQGRECIEAELESSRLNGALLASVLKRLRPGADEAALERSAFLIMSLGESTMRLAISVERAEGDALVENYKRMVLREMEG
jgi:AcrR family transcriptional regulator